MVVVADTTALPRDGLAVKCFVSLFWASFLVTF